MKCTTRIAPALALCAATAALAQTTVDPANKHAWAENIGWTNWRDAGGELFGARLWPTYLSGRVWSENTGWVNLGDGSPDGPTGYTNLNGTDFGVNVNSATGTLTGYAWGENIGWINFSGGSLAAPPSPARFDPATRRLRGYAWSDNTGWINLDHATTFVAFLCPADFNQDGFVDGIDSDTFNNLFEAGDPAADYNGDGFVDGIDSDDFNNDFEAGC